MKKALKVIAIVIGCGIVIIFAIALIIPSAPVITTPEESMPAEIPQETIPAPTSGESTPVTEEIPPLSESKIFEPITITGSGGKTSPPFKVTTKEWIIDWSYISDSQYAYLSFRIYPRGKISGSIEHISSSEATRGTTYSYAGPGEYYIKVLAANIESWEVIIRPA